MAPRTRSSKKGRKRPRKSTFQQSSSPRGAHHRGFDAIRRVWDDKATPAGTLRRRREMAKEGDAERLGPTPHHVLARRHATGSSQLLGLVRVPQNNPKAQCKKFRWFKPFDAMRWRGDYVAKFRYVPEDGVESFVKLRRDDQSRNSNGWLKTRLMDSDVLDVVKNVHPHLKIEVTRDTFNGSRRLRWSKGKSMMAGSSPKRLVDYQLEHTWYVEDDHVVVVFYGFLESGLNWRLMGLDFFMRLLGRRKLGRK